MSGAARAASLLVGLALAACFTRPDPLYCDEGRPCTDPDRPYCDLAGSFPASAGVGHTCIALPLDAGNDGICVTSPDCPAATPICVDQSCVTCGGATGDADCAARDPGLPRCAADGRCGECAVSADCADATPVCDPDGLVCRTCTGHDECASGVCDQGSGACVDAALIIYADVAHGSDGLGCGDTPATACKTLGGAAGALAKVTAGRKRIRIYPGTYPEGLVISALTVELDATPDGTTILTGAPGVDGAALAVVASADVVVDGPVMANATGSFLGDGVGCQSASLALRRVVVRDDAHVGIETNGCQLTVRDSVIRGNTDDGVDLVSSTADLDRCRAVANGRKGVDMIFTTLTLTHSIVGQNPHGGIELEDGAFTLENDVVAGNGDATAITTEEGGIAILGNPDTVTTQIIRHVTIADNATPPATLAPGLDCNAVNPVTVVSSILYGDGGAFELSGNCTVSFSDVQGGAPGTGNLDQAPAFVLPAMLDFHLAATSAGIDQADPASPTTDDLDGDARPLGAGFDMGADEVVP